MLARVYKKMFYALGAVITIKKELQKACSEDKRTVLLFPIFLYNNKTMNIYMYKQIYGKHLFILTTVVYGKGSFT